MDGEQEAKERDSAATVLLGSVHTSTSNILSYSLVTAAAMLAFFFAFQAALITYFSSLYSAFGIVSIAVGSCTVPVGKICLSILCIVMIMFTVWSLQMVRMTLDYINEIVRSGTSLEARIAGLDNAIFSAIAANLQRRRQSNLLGWTATVCWLIAVLWALICLLVWVPRV